nr:unnamed protein product [Callosobruchus chinensis]
MIKHVALALLLSYAVAFPDGSNSPKTTETRSYDDGRPNQRPPVPIEKWEGVTMPPRMDHYAHKLLLIPCQKTVYS